MLGYGSGTPTHDVDFAEAAPAVIDILTRYPHAELWVAGPMRAAGRACARLGARVRRFPLLAWREWFELAAQIDINLAPLEMNNIFCRAKSEIKFVEAAALGVPTVASQIDPFAAAITHGENGFLAANTAAVDRTPRPPGGGCRAAPAHWRGGAQQCVERYSPQARAADLAQLLPELLKTRAGNDAWTAEQPMQANEQS